jgi:hypothetical protein
LGSRDPKDLAAAVVAVQRASAAGELEARLTRARQTAAGFDVPSMVAKTLALYERVIARDPPEDP